MKCKHCKHRDECADDAFINGAEFSLEFDGENGCTGFEPFTNADRIRAMSDEELAGLLFQFRIDAYGAADGAPCILPNTMAAIEEWLKQPAEGE